MDKNVLGKDRKSEAQGLKNRQIAQTCTYRNDLNSAGKKKKNT